MIGHLNSFLISWAVMEFSLGDWTFNWLKSCAHARLLLNVSVSLYKLRKCVFVLQVLSKHNSSMLFASLIVALAVDGRSAAQQLYLFIRLNKEKSPNASLRFRQLMPWHTRLRVAINDLCIVSRKMWAWVRQRCFSTLLFGFIVCACKQTPTLVDQWVFFDIGCAFQAKDSFIYSVSKMCLFFFLITVECRDIRIDVQVRSNQNSHNQMAAVGTTAGTGLGAAGVLHGGSDAAMSVGKPKLS